MPLPVQTLVGNLAADPELRFTPSGDAVANFTVICSERKLNKDTDEWEDGDSMPVRCSVWREVAEAVAESLVRGSSVVVTGVLAQRSYETREGEKRYAIDCKVWTVSAQITRSQRVKVSKVSSRPTYDPNGEVPPPDAPPEDPWASRPPAAASSAGGYADEPPF